MPLSLRYGGGVNIFSPNVTYARWVLSSTNIPNSASWQRPDLLSIRYIPVHLWFSSVFLLVSDFMAGDMDSELFFLRQKYLVGLRQRRQTAP